ADPTIGKDGIEVLGDSAYATVDLLHTLTGKQWTPLVKPWPIQPAVAGGFTIDDFVVDHDARTATCPAGITRKITRKGNVTYGIACRECPLAARCTSAARGRKLTVGEHDQLQREHRNRAADE